MYRICDDYKDSRKNIAISLKFLKQQKLETN